MGIEFLNTALGVLAAVFSATAAIASVKNASYTKKSVQETQRMREAQTEPNVYVSCTATHFARHFLWSFSCCFEMPDDNTALLLVNP